MRLGWVGDRHGEVDLFVATAALIFNVDHLD